MDAATRDQLLERFREYLDTVDEPLEHAATQEPDLFTLFSEMEGLRNEVKLESRQVKAALDQFRELFDTLGQANARLGDELNRQREREALGRHEAERDLLLDLLELRDRLQAGYAQIDRYRPGWLARRSGAAEFVGGMAEGMAMNLRRLDDTLGRRRVRPLETLHRPFDPQTMRAAETEHRSDHPPGHVVGEIRTGFMHHDRLLRPAEVIVNKENSKP